uniref:Uncharacterized protein n=1 Tax=Rhizophora mucronata TaxID=61149 RepID=A0A2P2PF86_RHIMU
MEKSKRERRNGHIDYSKS